MGRSSIFPPFSCRGVPAVLLAGATLLLGTASAQESCVQVSNASFVSSCPCDAGSDFTFTMEGETSVIANTVNVAVIVDSSGSVDQGEFDLSKEFAKDTVAAFADQNLFVNGGTASFAHFSDDASEGGTFTSQADFDTYVDGEVRFASGTDIPAGVAKGRELLAAAPAATSSFMVVITDGQGGDPTAEADAARAEGTILFAVGVGTGYDEDVLLDIAGDPANVFELDNFTELDTALQGILSNSDSIVPCASNGAIVTVEFNAAVVSASVTAEDASAGNAVVGADGSTVTFELAGTLEATSTDFSVVLDFCDEAEGDVVVASVSYSDDEGNVPDLSPLEGTGAVVPTCDDDDSDDDCDSSDSKDSDSKDGGKKGGDKKGGGKKGGGKKGGGKKGGKLRRRA